MKRSHSSFLSTPNRIVCVLGSLLFGHVVVTTAAPPAIYRAVEGQPFRLVEDVRQQFPAEPIVGSDFAVRDGDRFFVTPGPGLQGTRAWFVAEGRWLEPRLPHPAAKPNNVVLSIVQPGVSVSRGGASASPAVAGQEVDAATTIRAGEGWAALTVGGVDTLHLLPGTEMSIEFQPSPTASRTRVNLKSGGVFSRIKSRGASPPDYRVVTPKGISGARGTDFVTLALPDRIEVWIAEGIVDIFDPEGNKVGEVAAADDNALKVFRHPALPTQSEIFEANAAIMTAAINFIQQANIVSAGIAEKRNARIALDPAEELVLREGITIRYLVEGERVR
ncbi:MAG: FecR domain-containing protein [Verrucomicrobiia bacterium]